LANRSPGEGFFGDKPELRANRELLPEQMRRHRGHLLASLEMADIFNRRGFGLGVEGEIGTLKSTNVTMTQFP